MDGSLHGLATQVACFLRTRMRITRSEILELADFLKHSVLLMLPEIGTCAHSYHLANMVQMAHQDGAILTTKNVSFLAELMEQSEFANHETVT